MPRPRPLLRHARTRWLAPAVGLMLTLVGHAARGGIIDDPHDFLWTFNGPHNGDLDVRLADATYNAATGRIVVTGRWNGDVGSTVDPTLGPVLYVFGFQRETGMPGFAALGLNVILFDSDLAPDTINAALATVPEPSALALMGLGGVSLAVMRTIIRRGPSRTA